MQTIDQINDTINNTRITRDEAFKTISDSVEKLRSIFFEEFKKAVTPLESMNAHRTKIDLETPITVEWSGQDQYVPFRTTTFSKFSVIIKDGKIIQASFTHNPEDCIFFKLGELTGITGESFAKLCQACHNAVQKLKEQK